MDSNLAGLKTSSRIIKESQQGREDVLVIFDNEVVVSHFMREFSLRKSDFPHLSPYPMSFMTEHF